MMLTEDGARYVRALTTGIILTISLYVGLYVLVWLILGWPPFLAFVIAQVAWQPALWMTVHYLMGSHRMVRAGEMFTPRILDTQVREP